MAPDIAEKIKAIGRVVNLANDNIKINTNMLDPGNMTAINRNQIEASKPSPISMMPPRCSNRALRGRS